MALSKEFDPLSEVPGLKKMSPFVILAVVLVLLWIFSPFVIVGAGERGVVFNQLHGVEDKILSEGFSFIIPIIERVIKMDVRIRKSDTRSTGASKDLQTVATEIVLNFHLFPEKVNKIYQDIGLEYEKRIIDPAVQEIVKAVTAKFTAEELITRDQLDRKSTRLNSSHDQISYAVFCLKKKKFPPSVDFATPTSSEKELKSRTRFE